VFQEGRAALAPGDGVEFGLVPEGLRYFSPDDGAALRPPSGAAAPAGEGSS
jgi:hypothetical protein